MSLSEELKTSTLVKGDNNLQEVNTIADTGPLSPFTKQIILHLFNITATTTTSYDTRCRSTIYETISLVVKYSSMV